MASDRSRSSRLDLSIRRTIDAPRALIWKVWTDPQHVKKWWAPAPWTTTKVEMDLRPGGIFRTVMRSPEGQELPHVGCLLELVPNEKMVMTNVLEPGYRPAPDKQGGENAVEECTTIPFTSILTLEERGGKTEYTVVVMHKDEAGRKRHEEMGFHEGWGTCLEQLIEVVMGLRRG
jgi:uncharacterized protein YndB with AHSA1/START domain